MSFSKAIKLLTVFSVIYSAQADADVVPGSAPPTNCFKCVFDMGYWINGKCSTTDFNLRPIGSATDFY
jgi:hypothetical protein